MHDMDADKNPREKARRKLRKNATSYTERKKDRRQLHKNAASDSEQVLR